MKQRRTTPGRIVNRRASFDYELGDDIVAGIVLSGRETKALRQRHGHLRGAYVSLNHNGELVLINATITGGKTFTIAETDQTRSRKLLVNKKQLESLAQAKQQGKSIVPIEFIVNGRYIKLRIGVGRGKKHYDKRETIKKT